ncbi:MAG: hypothetical protein ACLPWF_10925 [Bryobacteraceae bacterium]
MGSRSAIGWTLATAALTLWGCIAWTGFRPTGGSSRKGYDRKMRAIGGLILVALILAGMAFELANGAK